MADEYKDVLSRTQAFRLFTDLNTAKDGLLKKTELLRLFDGNEALLEDAWTHLDEHKLGYITFEDFHEHLQLYPLLMARNQVSSSGSEESSSEDEDEDDEEEPYDTFDSSMDNGGQDKHLVTSPSLNAVLYQRERRATLMLQKSAKGKIGIIGAVEEENIDYDDNEEPDMKQLSSPTRLASASSSPTPAPQKVSFANSRVVFARSRRIQNIMQWCKKGSNVVLTDIQATVSYIARALNDDEVAELFTLFANKNIKAFYPATIAKVLLHLKRLDHIASENNEPLLSDDAMIVKFIEQLRLYVDEAEPNDDVSGKTQATSRALKEAQEENASVSSKLQRITSRFHKLRRIADGLEAEKTSLKDTIRSIKANKANSDVKLHAMMEEMSKKEDLLASYRSMYTVAKLRIIATKRKLERNRTEMQEIKVLAQQLGLLKPQKTALLVRIQESVNVLRQQLATEHKAAESARMENEHLRVLLNDSEERESSLKEKLDQNKEELAAAQYRRSTHRHPSIIAPPSPIISPRPRFRSRAESGFNLASQLGVAVVQNTTDSTLESFKEETTPVPSPAPLTPKASPSTSASRATSVSSTPTQFTEPDKVSVVSKLVALLRRWVLSGKVFAALALVTIIMRAFRLASRPAQAT